MPVSNMKKLTVIAGSHDADAIVRKLMHLRCVEVHPLTTGTDVVRAHPDCEAKERKAQERLDVLKKALPLLYPYADRKKGLARITHRVDKQAFLDKGLGEQAYKVALSALENAQKLADLEKEEHSLSLIRKALIPWLDYPQPLVENAGHSAGMIYGVLPPKTDWETLEKELEEEGYYGEMAGGDKDGIFAVVTYHKNDSQKVQSFLNSHGFALCSLPMCGKNAYDYDRDLSEQLAKLEQKGEKIVDVLRTLAKNVTALEILSDIEATNVVLYQTMRNLTLTDSCVILSGWVPTERVETVAKALSSYVCACEVEEPEEGEEPPVLLKNNGFASNFEWVLGMYSYPKYGTYDPTFIMSIFYFIFFGMMFADVGYGLLLSLGCYLWIKYLNPEKGFKRMLSMFGICGISCMIMGVLFGGWFGDLPTAIMESFFGIENASETPVGKFFSSGIIFNPVNSPLPFLVLSLAVGEIHLITGMAINLVETGKQGKWMEGICSNVPYWIFFAGVDLMAPSFLLDMIVTNPAPETVAQMANLSSIGLIVFFAGLGCILCFKGWGSPTIGGWIVKGLGGLYNIISLVSDLLSYSRVLALGLVASVIASIINMLTDLGASGFIGFLVMLIVLVFGHILNIAINLLGTFVHAARLQYIEFFGKFYEDGGVPFKPVAPVEKYTEE